MTRLEKIAFDVIEDHFNGVLPLLSVKLRLYKRILAALKARDERAKRIAKNTPMDNVVSRHLIDLQFMEGWRAAQEEIAKRIASEEE